MKAGRIILLALVTLIAIPILASAQNRSTTAYELDDEGNVIRDSEGNCVRSLLWTPEQATVVGCDGYTLDKSAKFTEGQPVKGGVVELDLPYAETFRADSGTLSEAGKAYVDKATSEILLNMTGAYRIVVAGHTDTSGAEDYNYALSRMRAQSVADYLTQTKGIAKSKIRVLGMGPSEPIADNSTKAGREQNRRAEIIVVGRLRAEDKMLFPSATLFERRSADLSESGMAMLKSNLQQAVDKFSKASMVEVIGHTDDVGGKAYNDELSKARAQTVARIIEELGVNPNKIVRIGAGQDSPIASNSTDQGRQENRRVEILIVGRQR